MLSELVSVPFRIDWGISGEDSFVIVVSGDVDTMDDDGVVVVAVVVVVVVVVVAVVVIIAVVVVVDVALVVTDSDGKREACCKKRGVHDESSCRISFYLELQKL